MLAMPSMTWSWKIDWDHTRVKKGEIHRCVFRKAEKGWAMLVWRLRHKLGNNLGLSMFVMYSTGRRRY